MTQCSQDYAGFVIKLINKRSSRGFLPFHPLKTAFGEMHYHMEVLLPVTIHLPHLMATKFIRLCS